MADNYLSGLKLTSAFAEPISATWKSPSNIALVKYWGKTGKQLPLNPSLSMTLSNAHTITKLTAYPRKTEGPVELELWFEGLQNDAFRERIKRFLESIQDIFPWLGQVGLELETHNTFPHSAGIASSASAFSALALCLCSLHNDFFGIIIDENEFLAQASFIARLGSGSACRSLLPGFVLWGKTKALHGSSDLVAMPLTDVHPEFLTLKDSILIVNRNEKPVSSSEGHNRMKDHPFAEARIKQAGQNIAKLTDALITGDKPEFISIVENEAFTLHALMMSSENGYMLMEPETVRIISRIRQFRKETGLKICFTLDAGPNVHLLHFEKDSEQVNKFIVEDLQKNTEQNFRINDYCGQGPVKIA